MISADDKQAKVEIYSKCKKIPIDKNLIQELNQDDGKKNGY